MKHDYVCMCAMCVYNICVGTYGICIYLYMTYVCALCVYTYIYALHVYPFASKLTNLKVTFSLKDTKSQSNLSYVS